MANQSDRVPRCAWLTRQSATKTFYPQIIDGFERVVASLPAGSRGARYREPPAGWATQDIERRAFLVSLIACLINLKASTSGWCVIWEVSKGCPTYNDRFRHADFTNSAVEVAKQVAQRPDHEFPFFSLLLQFTSCGRRSGLLSSRQRCALTPRMRTEM